MPQKKEISWFIGCSGFHYKEWKEAFYPKGLPQHKWFEYYCEHFNSLELNVTFYRFPELSFLQNWYQKSPADFIFSVKAPQLITHYKKFSNTNNLLKDFYNVTQNGLGEKLGCVLFQLPRQLEYSEALLLRIIAQLDLSFNNVIEFRHPGWWRPEVYDRLMEHHITFCSISHPQLPDDVVETTGIVYFRFHGVPELYHSPYSTTYLQKVVSAITKAGQAYCYFNNTASLAALANARTLQQLTEH